jgi:hypothetical protein
MRRPQHIRVDVYHHWPTDPLLVTLVQPAPAPDAATRAILITKGSAMPGTITVDTTDETATLAWVDDKGDVTTGPAGVVVTFTSDTPTVATVAADATNPLQGDVTPVGIGTASIGATMANADGSPVMEADGVTPFPAVGSVTVTVTAGAAAGAALVLSV